MNEGSIFAFGSDTVTLFVGGCTGWSPIVWVDHG